MTQSRNLLWAPDAAAGLPPAAPAKPAASAPPPSTPAPAPAAPAAPSAPPPPTESDPFERPRKPAAAPGAKPAAPAKDLDPDDPKLNAPELRKAFKEYKTNTAPKISDYERKIAEYERRIASLDRSGQDTAALTKRLTDIEKERDEALASNRALRQESSPEFKTKYEVPFQRMASRAQKEIEGLNVIVTPADEIDGTQAQVRPATWGDFTELYALPTGKAIERAETLFGRASQFVVGLREKLLDLQSTRDTALEEERTQFKDRNAREAADNISRGEKIRGLFNETTDRLTSSNGDYRVDPTDTEAVEARDHALQVYDSPIKVTDEATGKKEVERRSHIRLKIGAFPVMKLKLDRAQEKITNLEAQLAELKGSAPGNTRRPGGTPPESGQEETVEGWMREAKQSVGAA